MHSDETLTPADPPRKPVRAKSIAPPPGWFEPAPKKPVRARLVGEEFGTPVGKLPQPTGHQAVEAADRHLTGWWVAWGVTTFFALALTQDAFPFYREFLQLITASLTILFTIVMFGLLHWASTLDRNVPARAPKIGPVVILVILLIAFGVARIILSAAPDMVRRSNQKYEELYWTR